MREFLTTAADYPGGSSDDWVFNYDRVYNRTSTVNNGSTRNYALKTNGLNQYDSVGSITFSYDNNGNLTNDGTWKYEYDHENRLTTLKNQSDVTLATYTYDWAGRRISKTYNSVTTTYVYDGDDLIAEYEDGILVRKYIYGPGIDFPVMMISVAGETETKYYYFRDALGSVVALLNNSGSVVEGYTYDSFGKPTVRTAVGNDGKWLTADDSVGSVANPYIFTGSYLLTVLASIFIISLGGTMKNISILLFTVSLTAAVLLAADERSAEPNVLAVGEFFNIYNPAVENHKWWLNDHCFVLGADGGWHFYAITDERPAAAASADEIYLAHGTASKLTQSPWHKEPFPLIADANLGETHIWAPHIIRHKGLYYMYYCAGDIDHTKYKINLATSKDLVNWQRHSANPMVVDGYDARDPFILKLGNKWIMYYTATSKPSGGYHTVETVVSKDLIHWSNKRRVYTDPGIGTWGGNTESPQVIRRGKFYYLFIGPGDSYVTTKVYRSANPFRWTIDDEVATIKAHAAEIVRDTDGKWFISHCGIGRDGLWLAPLKWNDGIDDSDTSCQLPQGK